MSINGSIGADRRTGAIDLRLPARTAEVLSRPALGIASLWGLVGLSLLVCVSASGTYALLPQSIRMVRPIGSDWLGPFGTAGIHLPAGVLLPVLSLLFASYVVAVRCAERLTPRAVLATIAALGAIVLLAPPLMSTDVVSYEEYARMFATYGANPYLHGPSAIRFDLLYPYIGTKWISTPTVYGPVFTLLSVLINNVTVGAHTCLQSAPTSTCTQAIALDTLAYKLTAALAWLAVVALLWHAARLRGLNQVRAVAVFGLNPLVVIYGVGGGHNDLLMLAFMTLGLYALLARRERLGGATIAISAAVKLTGAILLPFALAAGVGLGAAPRRRAITIGAIVASIAVAVVGFAYFGIGQLNLLPTLQQIQTQGDSSSIPGFLSIVLRLPLVGHLVGLCLGIAFLGVFAVLLRRVYRGQMDWIDGAGWATVAMLIAASAMLPWYVSWLMPLVALCTSRRLWRTGLWLTGAIQLITMIGYIPHVSS